MRNWEVPAKVGRQLATNTIERRDRIKKNRPEISHFIKNEEKQIERQRIRKVTAFSLKLGENSPIDDFNPSLYLYSTQFLGDYIANPIVWCNWRALLTKYTLNASKRTFLT